MHIYGITSPYACSDLSRIKNVEAFFPGEYSQTHYDGSSPENGWLKVKSRLQIHPIFNASKRATIPIYTLRHDTHLEQVFQIKPNEQQMRYMYTFTPKPKCGKVYDFEDEGSYRKVSGDRFQKIKHDERVIEGNLSWWGVDTHSWYNSHNGQAFGAAAASLRSERVFVSPFMFNPPESPYGDHGFAVSFKDLLNSYKESRTDIMNVEDRAVFLRVGGTLRYRYEICYVVIVCTKYDKKLECYPSLYTRSDLFDNKGLLLPSGQIKENFFVSQEAINFKLKYAIKCVPDRQYSSYEAPAFAFYYPEASNITYLKCPPSNVQEVQMAHKCTRLCHKSTKIQDINLDNMWDSPIDSD